MSPQQKLTEMFGSERAAEWLLSDDTMRYKKLEELCAE